MSGAENTVVEMSAADYPIAAGIMNRAFGRNEAWRWALVHETQTEQGILWWWAAVMKYGSLCFDNHISAGHDGIAIWSAPGCYKQSLWWTVRAGLHQAPFRLGFRSFKRIMTLMDICDKAHARHAPGPHWYLYMIAVDPPKQGRGTGSELLRDLTARADADGRPCYLESDDRRATDLYKRHGFRVVEELHMPDHGPFWEAMIRDPREAF